MLEIVKHTMHFHYYTTAFRVRCYDPEWPHDICGIGNKFEWDVFRGLSLGFVLPGDVADTEVYFQENILPAIKRHRRQHHHQMWNGNNGLPKDESSTDDLICGAIDAICSMREDRCYERRRYTYSRVIRRANSNPDVCRKWLLAMADKMQTKSAPELDRIVNPLDFPNIGVEKFIFKQVRQCIQKVVSMLNGKGYHLFN